MAGAWKSSDGGSIRCLGSSAIAATYSATAVLIAAATNLRGITLRTVAMNATGASGMASIEIGGTLLLTARVGPAELPYELFIPAGTGVGFVYSGGAVSVGITYDIH